MNNKVNDRILADETVLNLINLMNRGFLIYKLKSPNNGLVTWILKKIPTPADIRVSITSEISDDTSKVEHKSFKDALDHALFLAADDDEAAPIPWEVLIRYNRGLGPESKRLSDIFALTKNKAQEQADRVGKSVYEDQFIEAIIRPNCNTL